MRGVVRLRMDRAGISKYRTPRFASSSSLSDARRAMPTSAMHPFSPFIRLYARGFASPWPPAPAPLPVERHKRLDALVPEVDAVRVAHAKPEVVREMQEVEVEYGFDPGGSVQDVPHLPIVVKQVAGDPLDIKQLAERQVGIQKRHFIRGGVLSQIRSGEGAVAARKTNLAREVVASVLAFVAAFQHQGMMAQQAGRGEAAVGG